MSLESRIIKLSKQLFPTGRAFKVSEGSEKEKYIKGGIQGEKRAYGDALSILDSILPDNDNFDTDDAAKWEKSLGLITNNAVPLSDRKMAILRKMNYPGTVKPRENYRFMQAQLQAAGFDVYVYENRFSDGMGGYVTLTPVMFSYESFGLLEVQLGDLQLGDFQLGGLTVVDKIANSLDPVKDRLFNTGSNLKSTFFIGGNSQGSWADVDANRETEFRQLVIKLKPLQTVGFLLIDFV